MSSSNEAHSYGPTCVYYAESEDELTHTSGPPTIKAQFFYVSALPIDDPLSPIPQVASGTIPNHSAQPFSVRDNAALEEAWQGFQHAVDQIEDETSKEQKSVDEAEHLHSHGSNGVAERKVQPEDVDQGSSVASESGVSLSQDQHCNEDTLTTEELRSKSDQLHANGPSRRQRRSPFRRFHRSHSAKKGSVADTTSEVAPVDHEDVREQVDRQASFTDPTAPQASIPGSGEAGATKRRKATETRPDIHAGEQDFQLPSETVGNSEASETIPSEDKQSGTSKHRGRLSGSNAESEAYRTHRSTTLSDRLSTVRRRTSSARSGPSATDRPLPKPSSSQNDTKAPYSDRNSHPLLAEAKQNGACGPVQLPTNGKLNANVSGRPFARAPSRRNIAHSSADTSERARPEDVGTGRGLYRSRSRSQTPAREEKVKKVFVPVGVSRLHLVEFPDLAMKPIYWNPINDTSSVIRATWFYQESMTPVPMEVANRLEIGYEDIKPYTSSYQDELSSCVENGAAAEMKIVHKLWPDDSRPTTSTGDNSQHKESAEDASGVVPQAHINAAADPRNDTKRQLYKTHSVIYVDRRHAQILKPSLLPSQARNRTPLRAIRKGGQIGIAVVRGFDRKAWQKLHPDPKLNEKAAHAKVGAYMSQSGDATTRQRRMSCGPCDHRSKTPQVHDLVLVIHGIGQKLSERVDSYHFTHATNGLRREFNVELSSEAIKGTLKGPSGIMVLPVNWRLTMSFSDDAGAAQSALENNYVLQDITPDSLQQVRSLVSDVMLDIPYYMSHHKDKMIAAVIREANRVYRLWCRNNPGFEKYGRVHLIAHSLGSAMALDILSHQPTRVPKDLNPYHGLPDETIFEFDTTNLFCCGSPGGFFLLLHGANLVPRKGRRKPGMENEDYVGSVALDTSGKYGCLAIDNLYNIIHRQDPISYEMNACVDATLAASLQQAVIPSATSGLLARLSSSLRWASVPASNAYASTKPLVRPHLEQMPSTVEMETHNFSREEIVEKRMLLLNENGQIDYYLNAGGGALELQYLNMLSAHSTYWTSQDFVRFLVVEVGRKPGKDNTLPVLRATKKREIKRGSMA